MRRTKILCTIGPACDAVIEELLISGCDGVRFNFSHGTHEEHKMRLDKVRETAAKLNLFIPTMLDTKGPEIRLGIFENRSVDLKTGDKYIITMDECICNNERACVSYKGLVNDVKIGTKILIDDGLVELEVNEINGNDIMCTALNNGTISNNKSMNIPGVKINLPTLTDKDLKDIKFGVENNYDYIAASFIQSANDIHEIRRHLKEFNGEHIRIISKIENNEGLINFDEILDASDGIMIARGDLGVEIPMERLPMLQKQFIQKCIAKGKLVITATQMLDSMIKNPRPTRAEVSDIANAIYDGTGVIMLSGETASGKYPVESVKIMSKIAEATENELNYFKARYAPPLGENRDLDDPVVYRECLNFSIYTTAKIVNASAILAVSTHGNSPRVLSKFRPHCPVYVVTPNVQTARMLNLEWGIRTILMENVTGFTRLFNGGLKSLQKDGALKKGDIVVLNGGATFEQNDEEAAYEYQQILSGILRL